MATFTDLVPVFDTGDGLFRTISTLTQDDEIVFSSLTNIRFQGQVIFDGGNPISIETETIRVNDNFMVLNADYVTASDQASGFTTVRSGTATSDTVAGAAFGSTTTVATTGAATFSATDFVQITDADNEANNGIFEVLTHAANVLTIRTASLEDGFQSAFVADSTVAGTITGVNVFVMRFIADGSGVEIATGFQSALSFSTLASATGVTLQVAYDNDVDGGDAIITTNATDGAMVIAGDQKFQVTATNGLDVDTLADFDVTTFDVQMTGSNGFSIDGTAASNVTVTAGVLTLATLTSGAIDIDGVGAVSINSSGAAINIGDDANAFAIDIGTGAAARTLTVGNNTTTTNIQMEVGATGAASAWSVGDGTDDVVTFDTLVSGGEGKSADMGVYVDLEDSAGVTRTMEAATTCVAGNILTSDSTGATELADANTGNTEDAIPIGVARIAAGTGAAVQVQGVPGTVVKVRFTTAPVDGDRGQLAYLDNTAGQATIGSPPAGGGPTVNLILGKILEGGSANPADVLWMPFLSGKS